MIGWYLRSPSNLVLCESLGDVILFVNPVPNVLRGPLRSIPTGRARRHKTHNESGHTSVMVDRVVNPVPNVLSFFWGFLLASRIAQSTSFKYCSMVCLATCGRPLVVGTLAVYFWTPGPVIHMIWGVGVAVSSGKRFTVLCPTTHRTVSYLCRVVSPDHSNSYCSFEMSLQIWCVSWCRAEVPMISSIRRLRVCKCLVVVPKEMPCPWGGSPCLHDSVSKRWSYVTSLYQTMPVASSQDLASTSRVISAFDVQSHSHMARWRMFFIICQATPSVCIHLSTWVWRVWSMTVNVVVYPYPPYPSVMSMGDL
jgi:hypothetical protein